MTIIPEELRELQRQTRQFVDKEIIPIEQQIETERDVPERLLDQLRELGFFGLTIPAAYGGVDVGALGMSLVVMELARGHSAIRALISVNNTIGSQALVNAGDEAQKQTYLPRLASGELIACFALTEPGAGSDAAGIRTSAVRDGDDFVLSGMKHYVTHAPMADVFITLAVTDKDKGSRGGLTCFLIEKGTPGLSNGRVQQHMGSAATPQGEVIFEDCRVPASQVLGEVGWGFRTMMRSLDHGRLGIAAASVGNAKRVFEMSTAYAKERQAFGRAIGDFQAIQFMLADMATELYAGETILLDAAARYDAGEKAVQQCSMAKLYCSEMAGRVCDSAVQIHGGMGYMTELPIERFYREVRAFRIVEGTSEIQRRIIAKHVLK